jgi:Ca2+-binding EF-hand superfamily protein
MSPAAGAATTAGVVPSKQEIPAMAFDKLDPGKRGFVTRADVANLPGFESAFQQADENNDGRLSQDEFARAWEIYSLQP